MDTNITLAQFEVTDLERLHPQNIVWRVFYTATLTLDGKTASCNGFVGLFFKNSTDKDFIPFEQVTKAQAHDWMMSRLNEGDIYRISRDLQEQIKNSDTLTTVFGTPW